MADPFRTRDHVPDFDRHVADYAARSAATRARVPMLRDIAYGLSPAERLDLFFPPPFLATGAVHMFIHGGYWRMFAKEDFSFVAETVTRAGAIAVIVDYALMPSVRMETVVAQVRRARDWIVQHIGAHGGDPARLTISGHSAGAHLGALLFDASQPAGSVSGAVLISGIYDLAPLQNSFLAELIDLSDDEVRDFSPLGRDYPAGPNVRLLVGELETAPFHQQMSAFRSHLAVAAGVGTCERTLLGADHMSIVADLGTPGTEAANQLADCLAAGQSIAAGEGEQG
ncbi:alpha/beta hydrolase [Ancylobacter pratisalsi]|uniref:Alpha/beta hydrolase n=1 Tax=Ancylobacter pratisalsi TaxID=1745854 RepID=A0A6P1YHS9_9HYPH|nr:alpha/beta hydrolase [Ancylobacter pratisalsi]QIB32276.1 alpha/beta hydrolase [Ancylobacter pratisalsi]